MDQQFLETCSELDLDPLIADTYKLEVLEEFGKRFGISFEEIHKGDADLKIRVGFWIRNLARGVIGSDKIRFCGKYFTPKFYKQLGEDKDNIVFKIEQLECKDPEIWTVKNLSAGKITAERVVERLKFIKEWETKLNAKFPEGFSINLNMLGIGALMNTFGMLATCTGMLLGLASKHNGIITWKWDFRTRVSKLDLEILSKFLHKDFLDPELSLTGEQFLILCATLAVIFDLDYIEMFKFADLQEVESGYIVGVRGIVYR